MLVSELMTKEVISAEPDSTVEYVAGLLMDNKIHGVPVIEEGKPVGIITETDFFTKGSVTIYLPQYIDSLKKDSMFSKMTPEEKDKIKLLLNTKAEDIMSSPCITVNKDDDIVTFFEVIRRDKLTSVPVVDNEGSLVGIITLTDIVDLIKIKP